MRIEKSYAKQGKGKGEEAAYTEYYFPIDSSSGNQEVHLDGIVECELALTPLYERRKKKELLRREYRLFGLADCTQLS